MDAGVFPSHATSTDCVAALREESERLQRGAQAAAFGELSSRYMFS